MLMHLTVCSQDPGAGFAPEIHTECLKIDSVKVDLRNFHVFYFGKSIQHKNYSISNFGVQSQWHLVCSRCFTTTSRLVSIDMEELHALACMHATRIHEYTSLYQVLHDIPSQRHLTYT